jgi:tetratricopeptide (TPR) repeat protein
VKLSTVSLVLFLLAAPAPLVATQVLTDTDRAFRTAIELFETQQYAQSRGILESLTKAHPTSALYWFNLANSNYMLEDYEKALEAYRKVIALGSPLALSARLYAAKAYRRIEEYASAVPELKKLEAERLPPGIAEELYSEIDALQAALLEVGIELYRAERYSESLAQFGLALELKPNAETEMMTGLALLRLGRSGEAKQEFSAILEDPYRPELSPRLREDSQHFLRQIEKGDVPKDLPYWLFLDVAAEYDSNIFGDADGENSLSEPLFSVDLGAGYHHTTLDPLFFRVSYYLSWNEVFDDSSLRFLRNSIYGQMAWNQHDWLLELRPSFRYEILGTESFLAKPGIGATVQKRFSRHRVGLRYDYTRNLSPSSTYSYLEGKVHAGSLYWRYARLRWLVEVAATAFKEDIGDLLLSTGTLPLAQLSLGPRLQLSSSFTESWSLWAYTSYLFRSYDNPAQPDDVSRDDQQWNLSFRLSRRLDSGLGLFLSSSVVVNDSTLGPESVRDRNYTAFIVSGGFSWDAVR